MDQRLFLTSAAAIDDAHIARAMGDLRAIAQSVGEAKRHDEGVVEFAISAAQAIAPSALASLETAEIDANIRLANAPRPKLFVADMDSTMIGQECIDELADYAGVKAEVAEVTERAMQGELDFEAALRARVALLQGLDDGALMQCYEERIVPNAGAQELLAALRRNDVLTLLVSGGFTFFASKIAARLGFDRFSANTLEIQSGKLTGQVTGKIIDRAAKAEALMAACAELSISPDEAVAIGDGSNDLDMIEAAGVSIAYKAKPVLNRAAAIRLRYSRLDQLIPILGL